MPRTAGNLQTKKTHQGKHNAKTAEKKTEKWVTFGGCKNVFMKILAGTH
jgi:hypothetical protein